VARISGGERMAEAVEVAVGVVAGKGAGGRKGTQAEGTEESAAGAGMGVGARRTSGGRGMRPGAVAAGAGTDRRRRGGREMEIKVVAAGVGTWVGMGEALGASLAVVPRRRLVDRKV
jgi:hypothetical protein